MAANDNLIPQNKRTKEEQREIARKGGIASGKARKERKTLKEELLLLLEDEKTQKELSVALIRRAKAFDSMGNKAYEVIRDTIGEKPTDKLEFTQDKPFEVKIEVIK
jgi:hypothetical protein